MADVRTTRSQKKKEKEKTNIKFHFLVTPLAQTQNHQTAYMCCIEFRRAGQTVSPNTKQVRSKKKKKNDG